MKRFLKKLHTAYIIILFMIFIFVLGMQYYPDYVSGIVGFRFYTVLTDSMEPTIPTFSLVLTKIIPKDVELVPNTIVTFKADRFGEEILLTHYFRKTQDKDGQLFYRTQPEGIDINDMSTYDNYETSRDDIVGTYMFHVPYLGKIFLFLNSKFGYIMYAELFIIFLVNQFVKIRWGEKEKEEKIKEEYGIYEDGYVEGDVEVLIALDTFNEDKTKIQELEDFEKNSQIEEDF